MKQMLTHFLLTAAALLLMPAYAATENLDGLLSSIKADIAAKRLSSPAGNNALEKIDTFREQAPYDFRFVPLTYQWGETYVALAENSIAAKDYSKAQGYLDKVWMVAALTPGLENTQSQLDKVYKGPTGAVTEKKRTNTADIERQRKLEEAAVKEKARIEAEHKRKIDEGHRIAAAEKKKAEQDRQRKQAEERQRRADAEKAQNKQAAIRLADAQKTAVPVKIITVNTNNSKADKGDAIWVEAKEDSKPIASYPISEELLSNRDRDIVDSLAPVCQAILDNDASVVVHTENKADYRWLTVRLTLCLRRLDKSFRLRHSFKPVNGAEPFVTLHPSREVSLVRKVTD